VTTKIPPRLAWAVEILAVQGDDHLLEIGCGRGVAVSLICEKLTTGTITALDRSAKAIAAATARNERCIAAGRARFHAAALADAALGGEQFNKVFAVNVNVFWLKPARELAALRTLLAPDGALYLFYDPPAPSKAGEIIGKVRANLEGGGFVVGEALMGEAGMCVAASLARA